LKDWAKRNKKVNESIFWDGPVTDVGLKKESDLVRFIVPASFWDDVPILVIKPPRIWNRTSK